MRDGPASRDASEADEQETDQNHCRRGTESRLDHGREVRVRAGALELRGRRAIPKLVRQEVARL